MSAVRVYDKEQLKTELNNAGFFVTDDRSENYTIWKRDDGALITVNHSWDSYAYYYVNDLLAPYSDIHYNQSGAVVDIKKYQISHQQD